MMLHTKRLLGHKTVLVIALIYSIAITILFFLPTGLLVSGGALSKFNIPYIDKWVHGFLFFILTYLWQLYAYKSKSNNQQTLNTGLLFIAILLYGIIIEILQGLLTASRSADIYDVLADVTGALLAIIAFKLFKPSFHS